ncbi:DNA-binding protein P3A2-like isoform X2 [Dermacentor variabilis]|uniref:DNA-binding protein P3A2-like isoform X2 n=1 Tax=Dermacentor variabilis TaxID=34621 RepID=UPI003F5C247B
MNADGGELTQSLSVAVVSHSMMSADDLSDPPSSPDSPFDDSDLLSSSTVADDVTTQLAAAGPIGVAAAAAIATGKKRKRPHTFETNPSIRKRQQTRLLRKLKATIDEYTTRVGQQAVVLAVTPGKPQNHFKTLTVVASTLLVALLPAYAVPAPNPAPNYFEDGCHNWRHPLTNLHVTVVPPDVAIFDPAWPITTKQTSTSTARRECHPSAPLCGLGSCVKAQSTNPFISTMQVFGAHPLETVVRACRGVLVGELEAALAQQAPPQAQDDPTLHELPPLVVDGIPTPVEKMTQAQLRAFIPLMLKYSTGRGKPGWGKESTRPLWWPSDLPWANVRSDARSEEDKQKVSWTHALRQIVINCYRFHGREDLLPAFEEDDKDKGSKSPTPPQLSQQQQPVTEATLSTAPSVRIDKVQWSTVSDSNNGNVQTLYTSPLAHYTPTMVQTINNPDGTVSIIHVDPGSALLTLPDGTQAQVRTVSTMGTAVTGDGEGGQAVTPISAVNMELNSEAAAQAVATLAEATINHDGQIILTGEDGTQSAFPVSGMVTIPVSMYHGMQVTMAPVVSAEAAGTEGTGDTVEVLAVPVSTTQVD